MLKENYKNDMFSGDRKYRLKNNSDGTVSFEDVTTYSQVGDVFEAGDINETNRTVNELSTREADYIVESGTENGFTYRKWNSGVMEAWGSFSLTGSYTWKAWGQIYESSRGVTVTYPTGFNAKPWVNVGCTYNTGASSALGAHLYHYYDNSVEIYANRPNTVASSQIDFFVELRGRWK